MTAGPRRLDRRSPALTIVLGIALTIAAAVVGITWAFSSPTGSSPDEVYHLSAIYCPPPMAESGCPLQTDADGNKIPMIPGGVFQSACYVFDGTKSAACQKGLSRASMAGNPEIDKGGYPGGYYKFTNLMTSPGVIDTTVRIRIFNVALAVVLLGTLMWLMDAPRRHISAVALLSTAVPLGTFVVASVNPSSWAVTGTAGVWMSALGLWTTTSPRKRVAFSVLMVLSGVIAATARSDAAMFSILGVLFMAGALLPFSIRNPRWLAGPVLTILICAISFLTSGQSGALTSDVMTAEGRPARLVFFNNLKELPSVFGGIYGQGFGLGWLDTGMPPITRLGALAAVVMVITIGLGRYTHRKGLLAGGAFLLVAALAMYLLQLQHSYVGENLQPRYILPMMPLIVVLCMFGRRPDRIVRVVGPRAVLVWALLCAANAGALHANIRRYVTGQDQLRFNLNEGAEWWWSSGPSPMTTWYIGVLAFAVLASPLLLRGRMPTGLLPPRATPAGEPSAARAVPQAEASGVDDPDERAVDATPGDTVVADASPSGADPVADDGQVAPPGAASGPSAADDEDDAPTRRA